MRALALALALVLVIAGVALAEDPPRYRVGDGRSRVTRCDLHPAECSAVSTAPADINSGLRAWWTGSNVGASTWTDQSLAGKPLTLAAGAAAPTKISQAWEFNGYSAAKFYATDTEYAEVGTAADWTFLTETQGHTGFAQFVLQQTSGGIVASMFGSSSSNGSGIGIWISGTQQLSLHLAHASAGLIATYQSATGFVPYGTITTVVWRLNGSTNKWNIRVNGVEVNNSNASNYTSTPPTRKLRLGAYSTPTNGTPFGGLISDFALWDRPLTDVEVTALETWGNRTATTAFASDSVVLTPPLTGTVKLMYIGDSITEGVTGGTTLVGGYRHRVFDLNCAADAGVTLDGIGPYEGTLTPNGYVDNQSNGKSAATVKGNALTAQKGHAAGSFACVAAPGGCIDTMIGSDNTYRPDVVAVMLGTNDIHGISEAQMFSLDTAGNWCAFIADMHAREPAARFVLSSVLPQTGTSKNMQAPFNRAIQACAGYLRSQGVSLVLVDSYGAITNPATQLFDTLHPNDTGYGLIGDAFCPAIRRALGYAP